MSGAKKISQINIVINKSLANEIQDFLFSLNIKYLYQTISRSLMLSENTGLTKLYQGDNSTVDEHSVILTLFVDSKFEDLLISAVIDKGRFEIAGRGSIFSKTVDLLNNHKDYKVNDNLNINATPKKFPVELTGISAILMRGEGDAVARVSLDTGSGVPTITYGKGAGLRDKIGLWRITIPAEKDVVTALSAMHDADAVMNLMIDKGLLDQPGKGFIYLYPVSKGLLNTKIHIGMPKHAASMEQVINVIDEMKNGTSWRKREGYSAEGKSKRKFLSNLIDMSLFCAEGCGPELAKAAMSAGASGATVSKLKLITNDPELSKHTSARELCNLIIGEPSIAPIMKAFDENGAFNDNNLGQVVANPVIKACTYLGK